MSGEKKGWDSAVYGSQVACEYRFCEIKISNPVRGQKYCSQFCKDAEWAAVRDDGKSVKVKGGKHHSSIDSPLNQRVLEFLSDGKKHTSWEIMTGARVLDYRSAICDLRKLGFDITTNLKEVRPDKSKVYEYQLMLEV